MKRETDSGRKWNEEGEKSRRLTILETAGESRKPDT